jgi:hypothetical protein
MQAGPTRSGGFENDLSDSQAHTVFLDGLLQPKLTIGGHDDHFEREADAVADRVTAISAPTLQRKCTACESEPDEKLKKAIPEDDDLEPLRQALHSTEEPRQDAAEQVSRKSHATAQDGDVAPPIVHRVLQSSGESLASNVLQDMQSRFGRDFSAVRVHADSESAQAASAIQAEAFTVGRHIAFAAGRYDPASQRGRHLMAHELAHVVQQGGAPSLGSSVQRQPATAASLRIQRAISTSVSPGAKPSQALGPCIMGLTFPESIKEWVFAKRSGANWIANPTALHGNFSEQTRLLPSQHQVTGAGGSGNSSKTNFCDQVTELDSLGFCPGNWYTQQAVVAHENVHATHFGPALKAAAPGIETDFNAVTVADTKGMTATTALSALRTDPGFATAKGKMVSHWLTQILALATGDHGGVTAKAEHRIVDPMIKQICQFAKAAKWPACAACPP